MPPDLVERARLGCAIHIFLLQSLSSFASPTPQTTTTFCTPNHNNLLHHRHNVSTLQYLWTETVLDSWCRGMQRLHSEEDLHYLWKEDTLQPSFLRGLHSEEYLMEERMERMEESMECME